MERLPRICRTYARLAPQSMAGATWEQAPSRRANKFCVNSSDSLARISRASSSRRRGKSPAPFLPRWSSKTFHHRAIETQRKPRNKSKNRFGKFFSVPLLCKVLRLVFGSCGFWICFHGDFDFGAFLQAHFTTAFGGESVFNANFLVEIIGAFD